MALTSKLKAIANAIRSKTGKTSELTLEQMVIEIGNISSGGGMPEGLKAFKKGTYTVASDFTTTRQTVTHDLGEVPDLVIFWHSGNVATTYSVLASLRWNEFGWRSSAYNCYMFLHANSTTTMTASNTNGANYGVSNFTSTTFQISSHSSSYYVRSGTYNWIAVKFE